MAYNTKIPPNEIPVILQRLVQGDTYQAIGDSYGVSRERIRQIAKRVDLQAVGMRKRSQNRHQEWLEEMGKRYGEFFDGTGVNERDLLTECKEKYRSKKYNAKRTGVDFNIEFQDIIWNKVCPIFEIEIDYFSEGTKENSPSFDRIYPEKGYIKGNVQIISWRANRIKNNGTIEEHRRIAQYMANLACQADPVVS